MQNSNVTIEKTEVKKTNSKTSKNGTKQTTTAELQKQLAELEKQNSELLKELEVEVLSNANVQQEAEKLEVENATLKANALHHEQELKIAAQQAKEEVEKTIQLLKKELSESKKPTHKTAEEKLNRLNKANEISNILERKKELFKSFKAATTGDEQDQFKVIFQCSNGSNFPLANPEIIQKLTLITHEFMKSSISQSEQELLSYQV